MGIGYGVRGEGIWPPRFYRKQNSRHPISCGPNNFEASYSTEKCKIAFLLKTVYCTVMHFELLQSNTVEHGRKIKKFILLLQHFGEQMQANRLVFMEKYASKHV